jgi:uncharacterized membrane protein
MRELKLIASIPLLVVGMVILFSGAAPVPSSPMDGVFIALGVAMVLGYCILVNGHLNTLFRSQSQLIPFLPIFIVLGIITIVYGLTGAGLTAPHKAFLSTVGAILVVVSLVMFKKVE